MLELWRYLVLLTNFFKELLAFCYQFLTPFICSLSSLFFDILEKVLDALLPSLDFVGKFMEQAHFFGTVNFNRKGSELVRLAINMRLKEEALPVADLPCTRLFIVVFVRTMKSRAINQDIVCYFLVLLRIVF